MEVIPRPQITVIVLTRINRIEALRNSNETIIKAAGDIKMMRLASIIMYSHVFLLSVILCIAVLIDDLLIILGNYLLARSKIILYKSIVRNRMSVL